MMQALSDLCSFTGGRIAVTDLNLDTYISTENMLPNKEGIARSAGLPTIAQAQAYQAGDVLVSNIRPYFRKIWFADRSGGCSNDVLVLRAKKNCNPKFLYYVLSDDKFFDYATTTAKGTKMPRGDKDALMQYTVPDILPEIQCVIADTLSSFDGRISANKAINHHLASPMSATDSSPDIRRGKIESLTYASLLFSFLLLFSVWNIGLTISNHSNWISMGGIGTTIVFRCDDGRAMEGTPV